MCVSVPCVYLSLTVSHCLSLSLTISCLFTHSQSHTHSQTLTITCTCCDDEIKGSQDLFSCLFYDSLSFTASCCHCLLLPLPLADTVCHCFLLFSCCAVLCCLNSKERILIALEDTRNLKIYVKVFGTSQK